MNTHAVKAAAIALAMMLVPAAAKALLTYLASPDAARVMKAHGLE